MFQSFALLNDLIANLSAPYEERSHDITMLHESNLLNETNLFNNNSLCIYGDPTYPMGVHLQAPYQQAQNNEDMRIKVSPVGKIYSVCFILQNAHKNCLYGN